MEAILLSLGTFVSTFIGGLFGIKHRDRLHTIISFTAGVLIAVAFFDILPEVFQITTEQKLPIIYGMIAVVCGFLAIHVLEKLAVIHSSHEEEYAEHKHPLVGSVGAGGLAFHSFLDGVGIGLGFQVSPHVGLLIAIAVIAHDFCDGLNTVSLMLVNKNSIKRSLYFLALDAITPILGVLTTFFFRIPETVLVGYLGFFAGFLLYLGASDLLPEAHSQHSSYKLLGLTILGIVFIFIVTRLT
jgi:ZIP family zinc transporter